MKTLSTLRGALTRPFDANVLLQAAAIVLFAALLVFPYLVHGLSAGYDARTHVQYQHHFSQQFWAGDIYPRWLAGANKGYGSPIFLIQYPLPYFVTALLRPVGLFPDAEDREARELGVLSFLVVASAGLASRYWMTHFASSSAATLAALVYLSLPHFLITAYVNAAIGELCAFVFMPLALGLCESMHRRGAALFLLSGALALLLLSNLLIAALFVPAFVFYALLSGSQVGVSVARTSARLTLAIFLAGGIASVYLLPVMIYRGLFDPRAMAANLQDFELGHYFLYLTSGSLGGPRMLLATAVAVGLLVASMRSIWCGRDQRSVAAPMVVIAVLAALTLVPNLGLAVVRLSGLSVSTSASWDLFASKLALTTISTMTLALLAIAWLRVRCEARQLALLWVAAGAFALMQPVSAPVWNAIPALQVLQFPVRFGCIVMLAVAGLSAAILDPSISLYEGKRMRVLWIYGLAVLAVVLNGIVTFRIDDVFRRSAPAVRYDARRDIDVMYRTYVPPEQLDAFAEAMGTRPQTYSAVPTPGDGTLRVEIVGGDNCVRVVREGSRTLVVAVDCEGPVRLRIGQLNFPLWRKVRVAGGSAESVLATSQAGLIELWFSPGRQKLRLEFDATTGERWGIVGSAASLLVASVGYVVCRWRSRLGAVRSPC